MHRPGGDQHPPGSFKNPINLKSKGVIPLAVLTTKAGEYGLPLAFDATKIQPLTTRFGPKAVVTAGGGAPESHGKGHIEDAIERSDEQHEGRRPRHGPALRHPALPAGAGSDRGLRPGQFGPSNFVFQGCDSITILH